MGKIITCVVGPDVAKAGLTVGQVLVLKKGTYTPDPKSLKVLTLDGQEVGFVAASKKSGVDGIKYAYASKIFDSVSDDEVVTFVGMDEAKAVIEIGVEAKDATKNKLIKSFVYAFGGSNNSYPQRIPALTCASLLEEGGLDLQLKIGDSLVLVYDGQSAGIAEEQFFSGLAKYATEAKIELNTIENLKNELNNGASVISTQLFCVGKVLHYVEIKTAREKPVEVQSVKTKFSGDDSTAMNSRIDWLKKYNVDSYAINLFINHMKDESNIVPFEPRYIPNGNEVSEALATICGDSRHRGNLLLIGPAGCGKNMLILTLANLFNLPLIDKPCSAGTDEESLFGFLSMTASDELPEKELVNAAFLRMLTLMNGKWGNQDDAMSASGNCIISQDDFAALPPDTMATVIESLTIGDDFDYSVICDALRSQTAEIKFQPSEITSGLGYAAMINLDEVNALRPQVALALHSLLDTRRSINVSGYKTVSCSPRAVFTATMNEGHQYAGTSTMNQAFFDRWDPIDFCTPKSIKAILKNNVPTLSAADTDKLNDFYVKLMSSISTFESPEASISLRGFIATAVNIAQGNLIKPALKQKLLPRIRDEADKLTVERLINSITK